MEYRVMCPSCMDGILFETRIIEIVHPIGHENCSKMFPSDKCRKCGKTINTKRMEVPGVAPLNVLSL